MGDFNFSQLRKGDLVEILRSFGSTWAISVGNGYVVHLAHSTRAREGVSSLFFASAAVVHSEVKKQRLEHLPGFPHIQVNNKYDVQYRPRPPGDIVREAESLVGTVVSCAVTPKTCERWVVALRYNVPFTEEFPEPQPGDMIEFPRTSFNHWGLYVGNGYVVHLAPTGGSGGASVSFLSSFTSPSATVVKDLLKDVAGPGLKFLVKNLDHQYQPLPRDQILESAEKMIDEIVPYSVTTKNCEHFVTELRYGLAESRQVKNALGSIGLAAVAILALRVIFRV
ncbi:phospholipase A and acyltransferase 3 isoform X2 [Amia ocellicauda]|uniref:phospholipase A and acyltransferase 3 isoform X2 n=1 Tax=Amia ocellicauda TaxID=2972642 RepID=UPI0034643A02